MIFLIKCHFNTLHSVFHYEGSGLSCTIFCDLQKANLFSLVCLLGMLLNTFCTTITVQLTRLTRELKPGRISPGHFILVILLDPWRLQIHFLQIHLSLITNSFQNQIQRQFISKIYTAGLTRNYMILNSIESQKLHGEFNLA